VYHASFGGHPHDLDVVHVGTRQAALDRATNLAHEGGRAGDATLYEMRMHRPSPMTWADPNLPSEVSSQRLKSGGRWWQASDEEPPARPVRYVNEYEDPGSFSYIASPEHLSVTSATPIPRSELLKRTPTYRG
jgi:hypothetical protein